MARKACYLDFTTESGGQYILDSNTGAVIATNEIMQKAIDLYTTKNAKEVVDELEKSYPVKEVKGTVKFLQRWSKQYGGLYRTDKLNKEVRKKMEAATEADYEKIIVDGNITQLLLTVTEDCICRCKYCCQTEEYDYTRNRSEKVMTLETGIKALDMYFDYLKPIANRTPGKINAVSFFGGEPLINLDLIKKLVDYAQTHCPTNLLLNLSTNGYLLTDKTVDYLVDKDIKIGVSLDGTKKNHDRNRVLRNGKGTFDTVYRNIKRLQKRYPDYTGLMLIPVYDWLTDLEANVRFFEDEDLPIVVFVNPVIDLNTDYYSRFTPEDKRKYHEQYARLLGQYKDFRKRGDVPPDYLRSLFLDLEIIRLRIKGGDKKLYLGPYTSTCIPGYRLHVRVDGTLDMCERINEKFPIGHVDTGLDFTAIKRTMDLYNSGVCKECHRCALSRYCCLCPAACHKDCEFGLNYNCTCSDIRAKYKKDYSVYYSLYEENPHAFDKINLPQIENMALFT